MHVSEILSRHRNDYVAIMECEHCGHRWKNGAGYADAYYAYRVIPAMHCS